MRGSNLVVNFAIFVGFCEEQSRGMLLLAVSCCVSTSMDSWNAGHVIGGRAAALLAFVCGFGLGRETHMKEHRKKEHKIKNLDSLY